MVKIADFRYLTRKHLTTCKKARHSSYDQWDVLKRALDTQRRAGEANMANNLMLTPKQFTMNRLPDFTYFCAKKRKDGEREIKKNIPGCGARPDGKGELPRHLKKFTPDINNPNKCTYDKPVPPQKPPEKKSDTEKPPQIPRHLKKFTIDVNNPHKCTYKQPPSQEAPETKNDSTPSPKESPPSSKKNSNGRNKKKPPTCKKKLANCSPDITKLWKEPLVESTKDSLIKQDFKGRFVSTELVKLLQDIQGDKEPKVAMDVDCNTTQSYDDNLTLLPSAMESSCKLLNQTVI